MKKFLMNLLFSLSKQFPKKKNFWIFGAWQGKLYADNSKYLFRYINENYKYIDCVWISKNPTVVEQIKKEGYKAYNYYSLKAMWCNLRAEAAFETEGNNDLIPYLIGGAKKIQLWHGFGIKDNKKFVKQDLIIDKNNFNTLGYAHIDDYWMLPCEPAARKYNNAFGVDFNRMFITGQPKDDTFVWKKPNATINQIRLEHPGCKIYVYLPTHRNFGRNSEFNDVMSLEQLTLVNEKLKKENIIMIFKPHFHEFKKYEGYTESLSNIIFATDMDKYGDVYEFLPVCDGLITDYSGIMFGYLAASKPIIYFTYDYDEYMNDDFGFYYNFDDITYGPNCKTWDEVVDQMAKLTDEDYADKRVILREKFCPYADGNSCERVYLKVKQLLNS